MRNLVPGTPCIWTPHAVAVRPSQPRPAHLVCSGDGYGLLCSR